MRYFARSCRLFVVNFDALICGIFMREIYIHDVNWATYLVWGLVYGRYIESILRYYFCYCYVLLVLRHIPFHRKASAASMLWLSQNLR